MGLLLVSGGPTGPGDGGPDREGFEAFLEEALRDYRTPPETPRESIWEGIVARRGGASGPADPLPQGLRDYHRPPETPRARIWERIREERRRGRSEGGRPEGGRDAADRGLAGMIEREAAARTLAAAAVLVMAVALAWWTAPPSPDATAPEGGATASAPTAPGRGAGTGAGTGPPAIPDAPSSPAAGTGSAADAREDGPAAGPVAAPATRPGGRGGRAAPDASGEMSRWVARRLASRADVVLTSIQTGAEAGAGRRRLRRWAGEVLVTTRLLLDSPLTDDPEMRRLLRELELILARIRSLSGRDGSDQELRRLRRDLREADMISRLRTSVAEGPEERRS